MLGGVLGGVLWGVLGGVLGGGKRHLESNVGIRAEYWIDALHAADLLPVARAAFEAGDERGEDATSLGVVGEEERV